MPQKRPSQAQKTQTPQLSSSQVQSSQQPQNSFKRGIIIALISSPVIAAIVTGIFLLASLNRGTVSSPTPITVGTSPLISTPTPTPIPSAFVHGSFSASSGSTNMVSLSVTPGDLLIVAVTQYERTLLGSNPVTDDKGDHYHEVGNVIANPDQQQDYAELYYAQSAKGGLTTVTISFIPPPDMDGGDTSLGLYEYRGLGSLDTVLATTSKDASGKILTESSKLNTTAASEMCFALGIDSGPQKGEKDDIIVTEGDGYTSRYPTGNQTTDSANGERFYTEDAFVAPGGCNPNFTIAYPSFWGIIGAAFKP